MRWSCFCNFCFAKILKWSVREIMSIQTVLVLRQLSWGYSRWKSLLRFFWVSFCFIFRWRGGLYRGHSHRFGISWWECYLCCFFIHQFWWLSLRFRLNSASDSFSNIFGLLAFFIEWSMLSIIELFVIKLVFSINFI